MDEGRGGRGREGNRRQVCRTGPGSRANDGAEADDRGRTTQRWCSQPRNSAIQRLGKSVRKNSVEITEKPAGAGLKRRQIEVGGAPARPGNPHSGPTQPKRGHRLPGEAKSGQETAKSSQKLAKTQPGEAKITLRREAGNVQEALPRLPAGEMLCAQGRGQSSA